jgi:hypothetical protein
MQLVKYNRDWEIIHEDILSRVDKHWWKVKWSQLPLAREQSTYNLAQRMFTEWANDAANSLAPKPIQYFQESAVIESLVSILCGENILLLAGTGTGKTYMIGITCDILFYHGYLQHKLLSRPFIPFPILYIVNASSVPQITEVMNQYPNIRGKIVVINYEQLRAKISLGAIMVKWKKIENGDYNPKLKDLLDEDDDGLWIPQWEEQISPLIIIRDEIQKLKNNTAQQTKINQAFSITIEGAIEIGASATPFVRPSECKTIALSLKPPTEIPKTIELGSNLTRYNPEMDLLNEKYKKPLGRIIERVNISNYEDWINNDICTRSKPIEYSPAAMERLTNHLNYYGNIIHVRDVKFPHKSINKHVLIDFQSKEEQKEYLDAFVEYCLTLAKANRNTPEGLGAIMAARVKFNQKAEYMRRFHMARIIDEQVKRKQSVICAFKFKKNLELVKVILQIKYGYTDEFLSEIKGGQSKSTRWENINKFQDDKAWIMLLMLQAGGTGLSLHHHKPRNKRQRFVVMPPVDSIIEMLQVLGRAHRINSASTTHQWILWYRGTVEEDIYHNLMGKSLSMRELMRRKESWSELFTKPEYREHVKKVEKLEFACGESNNVEDEDDAESKHDTWNTNEDMISNNVEQEKE